MYDEGMTQGRGLLMGTVCRMNQSTYCYVWFPESSRVSYAISVRRHRTSANIKIVNIGRYASAASYIADVFYVIPSKGCTLKAASGTLFSDELSESFVRSTTD
jgi:hypothetical protein